ncbi:hypothetical protein [Bifidobacterium cuniculi]|uniref:Uncharacterized protein n=1 Tax=Bifidobacterium cuniculi TaxID=1688 RepID=A0A087AX49_9BIFI|nr:hypothetical protein [Bifidobacterium cuniculi]KFI63349.1 hypothetical protein BCUN_1317 [Bifidobacterium cuniculi]
MNKALDLDVPHMAGDFTGMSMLWTVVAVALLAAAALAAATVWLSRPKRRRARPHGAHAPASSQQAWLQRIQDVVSSYESGSIGEDEAYAQLAAIARRFASERSGRTLTTHTLSDLERAPRGDGGGNWDALRLTISALYPPEFADPGQRQANVRTAAGWVADLVERWR